VIVWINGAFGVGKTTVAGLVRDRIAGARLFDPEYVGFLLRHVVDVPTGDFQDLRLWRRLTVQALAGLVDEYPGVWLVPMTLTTRPYRDEIHGGLRSLDIGVRQFVLVAPEPVLRARIDEDPTLPDDARMWRHRHVGSALAAVAGLRAEPDTVLVDASVAADAVAARIVERCADLGRVS
jgi:hypothetical protein